MTSIHSMLKSDLAEVAGVSYSTFYRFLRSRRDILTAMGCNIKDQTLKGKALEYVCEEYDITLPEKDTAVPKLEKFR